MGSRSGDMTPVAGPCAVTDSEGTGYLREKEKGVPAGLCSASLGAFKEKQPNCLPLTVLEIKAGVPILRPRLCNENANWQLTLKY